MSDIDLRTVLAEIKLVNLPERDFYPPYRDTFLPAAGFGGIRSTDDAAID